MITDSDPKPRRVLAPLRRPGFFSAASIVAIVLAAMLVETSQASAQGVLRRLGERVRENASLRAPLLGPRDPLISPAAPRGSGVEQAPEANRPPTATAPQNANSSRSNYNRPQPQRSPNLDNNGTESNRAGQNLQAGPRQFRRLPTEGSATLADAPPARLGVSVEAPPPVLIPGRGPRATRGAAVVATVPGSSAEAAGLLPGDVLISVNGQITTNVSQFLDQLAVLSPGEGVELRYIRDERLRSTTTVMADASGKLDPATYADIRSIAGPTSRPEITRQPSDAPGRSSVGGIGNAVSNWLGGRSQSSDELAPPVEPASGSSPFTRDFDPVMQTDYESLQPRDESSLGSSLLETPDDPPSLQSSEAVERAWDDDIQTLPAPVRTEPAVGKIEKSSKVDAASVEALRREVERLQQQLKKLESQSE